MNFYLILQRIMDEKGLKIPDVARKCSLSDGTIRSAIVRKSENVSLEVAFKIADGLGVSLERLNGMPEKGQFCAEKETTPSAAEATPGDVFISIEEQFGADTRKAISMYVQLDRDDQGEIRGEMKQMLKADKYKKSTCFEGETAKAV